VSGIKKTFWNFTDPLNLRKFVMPKAKKQKAAPATTAQLQPTMDQASAQAALDEQTRRRLANSARVGTVLDDGTSNTDTDQLG
jgi:hypothetical protein